MLQQAFEEQSLPKNPRLELAHYKYMLGTEAHINDPQLKTVLFEAIKQDNMAPFYQQVCDSLNWSFDSALYEQMRAENEAKVKKLDEKIEDATKNLGEMEVRESYLEKFEYLSIIGNREAALEMYDVVYEKTASLGHRLDLIFHLTRIGLFYLDHDIISKNIEKAKALIEEGGDWDRRNRHRVYNGLYCVAIRDFKTAANLFLTTISTFTCYELMDYKTFVTYTVLCGLISLTRVELREKVVRGAEILEVLHSVPDIKQLLFSFYNCQYAEFFQKLVWVENFMKSDRYFAPHTLFFIREMRILAYNQLLESYRSLTLEYMANAFGVSVAFIDAEISRFIAAGRLHCKIDKVYGIVETNRPDLKNYQYQACIKQGDFLLNRIQKLSRIINM